MSPHKLVNRYLDSFRSNHRARTAAFCLTVSANDCHAYEYGKTRALPKIGGNLGFICALDLDAFAGVVEHSTELDFRLVQLNVGEVDVT